MLHNKRTLNKKDIKKGHRVVTMSFFITRSVENVARVCVVFLCSRHTDFKTGSALVIACAGAILTAFRQSIIHFVVGFFCLCIITLFNDKIFNLIACDN